MNTDGHAKGYAFDGLHSHFPAVPLIPISTFSWLLRTRPSVRFARPVKGRLVKYNFMDDSKYWSPLETSQMLNPYR